MTLDPALGRKLREAAERITTARTDRDRLVIQAYEAGASLREIAFELGVPYDAYIPFMEQPAKWSSDQKEHWIHLANNAREIKVISPGSYKPWKFQERNKAMVNACNVLDAHYIPGISGGTMNCMKYALRIGRATNHHPV